MVLAILDAHVELTITFFLRALESCARFFDSCDMYFHFVSLNEIMDMGVGCTDVAIVLATVAPLSAPADRDGIGRDGECSEKNGEWNDVVHVGRELASVF